MKMSKLLQGTTFAVAAAACVIAVPGVAKAADGAFTDAGITGAKVNGTTGQLEISSSAKEVLVGFGTVNAKKGTITVASWDSYEPSSSSVNVDLSKLSNVKDNYVVLTTPGKDVSIIKIPAVAKVTKAKFDAGKGTLLAASGANAAAANPVELTTTGNDPTAKLYEYRTAYSSWTDVQGANAQAAADFKLYQEEGAKLFVRLKGKTDANSPSSQADEAYKYGEQNAKVYVSTGSLPGKEAKVAIAAKAKGPKVTADYAKGTIKFPKGSEYRLASDSALQTAGQDGKYTAGPTTATSVTDLVKDNNTFSSAAKFTVEVRTAATDKKAASKWTHVSVTKPAKLGSTLLVTTNATTLDSKKTNGSLPAQGATESSGGGAGIKNAQVKEDATKSSVLTINYVAKKLDATKFYLTNAIEIQNKGEKTYEVVVGTKDAQATSAPADAKAVKIAPNKTVTLTKVEDGTFIWIRVAGDKKTQTWVGEYDKLGIVDYTFKVPAQTASTT